MRPENEISFDNENLESIEKTLQVADVPVRFKDERLKQIQFYGIIKDRKNQRYTEMFTKAVEFKVADGVIEVWPVKQSSLTS